MGKEQSRVGALRDQLQKLLLADITNAKVNGSLTNRLAGNLNITLPGVDSEALMIALKDKIAISSGSACTTAAVLPPHVLKALGLSDADSHCTLRFDLERFTVKEDIDVTASSLISENARLSDF